MKHEKMILVLCVCLLVLGFGVSALVGIWRMYQEGTREYKGLQEFVSEETETDESGQAKDTKKVEVDFASLKEINKDLVAWIRCEALGLDYPVVQGKDNDYYLDHTFSGEEHISGCIFMDCGNKADFTDDNTILYGHNMKDGSMFGLLGGTADGEIRLFLYTENGVDTYQIVDNRTVAVTEALYFRLVYGADAFEELSAAVAAHTGTALVKGEHLLTLSTCNGNTEKRHIILLRKVAEETESPEVTETLGEAEITGEAETTGGTAKIGGTEATGVTETAEDAAAAGNAETAENVERTDDAEAPGEIEILEPAQEGAEG